MEGISSAEKDKLFKAPVLVSLLAAAEDGSIKEKEKRDAIKLSHLRPFTSPKILHSYYREVEKGFEGALEAELKELPPGTEEKKQALKQKVKELDPILDKLEDQDFAEALRNSLKSYAQHIARIDQNVVEYFVLPMAINYLQKESGA